jgi:hypothetical protein
MDVDDATLMEKELSLIGRLEQDAADWQKAAQHTRAVSSIENPPLASESTLNQAWADYYARRTNALRRRFWSEYPHPIHRRRPFQAPPSEVTHADPTGAKLPPPGQGLERLPSKDYNQLLREAHDLRDMAADPNFTHDEQARALELAKMKEAQAARIMQGLNP